MHLCHYCKRLHYDEEMSVVDEDGLNLCVYCENVRSHQPRREDWIPNETETGTLLQWIYREDESDG
jgi:hypothetical protein